MKARRCLHPNLGAEDERPLSVVDAALAQSLARTWALLFEDVEIDGVDTLERPAWLAGAETATLPFLEGARGLMPWLSTSDAEARAKALGLPYAAGPSALTRLVSDKAWALSVARELSLLPSALASTLHAFSPDELSSRDARALIDERLSTWPDSLRGNFTLKPRFGSSGRGRVKGRGGRLDDAGAAALSRLARRGGAVLEPWLQRVEDLSAQLLIDESGHVHLLGTTRQLMTPSGVWLGNVTVLDDDGALLSGSAHEEELQRAVLLVGERVAREGFRGPLGLDAFSYREPDGGLSFRALVELNPRFTMGLVTLGLARRAARAGRLLPSQVCAFQARATGAAPSGVERLPLPQGALDVAADYSALSVTLPAGGNPKRR